jgi:hypothetical protein
MASGVDRHRVLNYFMLRIIFEELQWRERRETFSKTIQIPALGACLACLATYFSGTRDYPGSLPEATKPQPPARRSNSPRYVRQLLPCFLRNKQEGTHGRPPGAPARIAGCLASYRPAGQLLLAIFKSKGYAWRAVASYVVATLRKQGARCVGGRLARCLHTWLVGLVTGLAGGVAG